MLAGLGSSLKSQATWPGISQMLTLLKQFKRVQSMERDLEEMMKDHTNGTDNNSDTSPHRQLCQMHVRWLERSHGDKVVDMQTQT